VVFHLKKITLF